MTETQVNEDVSLTFLTCSVIFATKSSSPSRRIAWFYAIISFLLVSMQTGVLGLVIFESSHPTCASNADCKPGNACEPHQKSPLDRSSETPVRIDDYGVDQGYYYDRLFTPSNDPSTRCHECHYFLRNYYEWEGRLGADPKPYCDALLKSWYSDNRVKQWDSSIDSSKLMWINGPGAAPVRLDHNSSDWRHPTRVDFIYYMDIWCFSFQHCLLTDMMPLRCDHLVLDSARLHWTHYCLLYGLSIFVWAVLSKDMGRALEEERCLLKRHEDAMLNNADISQKKWIAIAIAVQLLRACLRVRRFSIPVLLTITSATMILYGGISAANIVLNVLAVAFLLDADAHASTLFLPSEVLIETKREIVKFRYQQLSVECNGGTIGTFGTRACSFCCTVLLCVTVMRIEDLIIAFGVEEGALCSDVTDALGNTLYICIAGLIGTQFVLLLVASYKRKLTVKQVIISAFDELLASGGGLLAFSCTYGIFLYMGTNRRPADYWWLFIVGFCVFMVYASMMGIVTFCRVKKGKESTSGSRMCNDEGNEVAS